MLVSSLQLAQSRRPGVLAAVDAALRHLPDVDVVGVLGAVDAAADEGEAGAIEHGHADAAAIGEGFERRHFVNGE